MSHQQQVGWEWSQEDEQRWELERERSENESIVSHQRKIARMLIIQQDIDRITADFDSIFMNEGE